MNASAAQILSQFQHWAAFPSPANLSDATLLQRFILQRDESAFAALMARHGAMVLRVCRRVLGDAQDAEDAFQAAFLILARKAGSLKQPEALPGWLHGVARRVALKARTKSASRFASDLAHYDKLPDARPDPLSQLSARELLAIVDEEVQRLPAAQRSAVVLCCLEGCTQEEAARMLGWTVGSVKGRLERGRCRLHQRLTRRGITLSAALAIVALSRGVMASAELRHRTIRAVLACGEGAVSALADCVLKGMLLRKIAGLAAVGIMTAFALSTTLLLLTPGPVPEEQSAEPRKKAEAPASTPHVETLDDPLPEGALARLGTTRLRHGDLINFAAFTPNGKRLVSQGSDGVRVWDTATGKQLLHLAPQPGRMWSGTDLSPDGKCLASAGYAPVNSIHFWDIDTGRKIDALGQRPYVMVRFSPDGKFLVASENTRHLELWDLTHRKLLHSWEANLPMISFLAFSADSRRLVTSGGDGKYRLWEVPSGRPLREFLPRDWKGDKLPPFHPSALSPDGNLLAILEGHEQYVPQNGAMGWRTHIGLHETKTGKKVREIVYSLDSSSRDVPHDYTPHFFALAFTPDGKSLLTGGPDHFLRAWDSSAGGEASRWSLENGRPFMLIPSKDGQTLAIVVDQGKAIQLLDMANGKPRISHAGHRAQIYFAALTPNGQTAITVGADNALFLWDATTGRPRQRLKGHDTYLFGFQPSRDGRTLFTGGWDRTIRVWNLDNGEEQRRIELERDFQPAWYDALALSPKGGHLALLSATKSIRLLDAVSGREVRRFQGPEAILGSARTPDGQTLVVWSGDRIVRMYDVTQGRLLHEYTLPKELAVGQPVALNGPSCTFYGAALSPDGRLLAVGNRWHTRDPKYFLVFKDLASGRDVRRIDNLPADANRLAFSPDGRILAWSGTKDYSIHLMETASGRERCRFAGHQGMVQVLTFSADGEKLLSSGFDTTALVWDLRSRFDPHKPPVSFSAAQVKVLWDDLAADDAVRAYQAVRKLASAPAATVPFLRQHLQPVPSMDPGRVSRWIADLDSEDFPTRQKAVAELEKLGETALPAYRAALDGKPSIEMRRRLEALQEKAESAWWNLSGEPLRSFRAIEVLERVGTESARDVLATLAGGDAGARLTEQAKAARARLANRTGN